MKNIFCAKLITGVCFLGLLVAGIQGYCCYQVAKDYRDSLDTVYEQIACSLGRMEEIVHLTEGYLQPEDNKTIILATMRRQAEIAEKVEQERSAVEEINTAIDKVLFQKRPVWVDEKIPKHFEQIAELYRHTCKYVLILPGGSGAYSPYPQIPIVTTLFGTIFYNNKTTLQRLWFEMQAWW